MPDLWMDVDTALSEVPVNITPLIDATDFKTIEDAVAYNAAGLALYWHFVTSAGAYTVTAVTPTTAGTYDWTDQGAAGIYTIEIPASGGASINNDTEGFGWFTGVATGILPWRGPVIGFRAAALNDALIDSAWSTTRGLAGTALPNAAADAAGGLAISDAGGLDLDSKLAATNEVTAARMGALTDWIDGGRLDLLLDAIKAVTDALPNAGALTNLDAAISSRLASSSYTAPPSAASNADAVWDEAISGHLSAGSTGLALNSAGSAGDPWSTAVPGAYGAGTAGKILGDNLNATVSSRAVAGDAMALTSSERTTLAAAIWNALTSGMSTVGSIGKKLADWVVGTIDTYTGNTKQTGDSYSVVTHVTYGNSALHDDITTLQTYIDTEIAAILEDTGTTLPAQIAALNNLSASQVNAEVLDVLATDTAAELAAVPAANASLKAKITFLAMLARNKLTQTATQAKVYADDGTTQVGAATVSDDATTYTRSEWA